MTLQLLRFLWDKIRGLIARGDGAASWRCKTKIVCCHGHLCRWSRAGYCASPFLPRVGIMFLFMIILFNGMPVSFAMGLFGIIGFFMLVGEPSVIQAPMIAYNTCDSIVIVAFPLFVLSGTILEAGNIGPRIFHFANTLVRHLPGGMGIAAIVFCGLFAAMTGSSIAVAAAVSVIALPEMLKRGYSRQTSHRSPRSRRNAGDSFPTQHRPHHVRFIDL